MTQGVDGVVRESGVRDPLESRGRKQWRVGGREQIRGQRRSGFDGAHTTQHQCDPAGRCSQSYKGSTSSGISVVGAVVVPRLR
jgi:hypothetical protein